MQAWRGLSLPLLLLSALGAGRAHSEPSRTKLLFAVGDNIGAPDDPPLRFAGEDARRVSELFQSIGGVAPDHAYLLLDSDEEQVRERFAELGGRIAELSRSGTEVELTVYVSAHARAGTLQLRGTQLPLAKLRAMAEQTAARVRVLIIDACDSGAAARQKGGTLGPEYDVKLDTLSLGGTVLITSSGPAEPAQEWGSLGGSLFTHHLLTGLRGDADIDGDGRVTVSEAYGYAYRRTVLDAVSRSQHPAFDLDLAGTGELVLSEPGAARSALIFPADLEGRYVVASQPRPDLLSEVEKRRGRPLRLAVPPGRYILRKRLGRSTGVLSLELPYGGEVVVDEARMVRRSFAEVAIKGGRLELHPWSVVALGQVETSPFPSRWGRWRAGLAVRRTWGELWGQLGLLAGGIDFRGQGLTAHETSLALQISGGYRWLLTPVIPYVGLSVQLTGYRQAFVRDEEARIQAELGMRPIAPVLGLGVAAGPVVGLEFPLWQTVFAWISVSGRARYLEVESVSPWSFGADAEVGIGWIW